MADGTERRDCLECPYGNKVPAKTKHLRCTTCREDHVRGKEADAQYDRRKRQRDEDNARRVREGKAPYPPPPPRRKDRTPSWDRYGRVTAPTPRLTPTEIATLRRTLDDLDRAVAAVRKALDPPRW